MKEHCVQTNQTFDIIRTAVGETAFPNTWEDLQGNPWKVFQVQAGSNEYNQVIQKFQQGAAYIQTIVKLERIQNVALYKQFLAQEEKVRAKMSSRGVGQTVTRELFHGTSGDVTDNIYRNGFDRSHAGKNATAYGKGVYFAVQAQYSHNYTSLDRNNHRCMFLSKVVTGEYCAGNSSMITAPAIAGGQKNELYDSVVNRVSNPTMYVVFKDASVYPDYVLTYQ
nr:poly [ADP-ribose] polymerase 15-like [Ciona intestinalis]|eukprot:XP_002126120.2 poly [ADP-ribose] polymerase 15-like [Ciona intestinalis]